MLVPDFLGLDTYQAHAANYVDLSIVNSGLGCKELHKRLEKVNGFYVSKPKNIEIIGETVPWRIDE